MSKNSKQKKAVAAPNRDQVRAMVEAKLPKPKPKVGPTEEQTAKKIADFLTHGKGKNLLEQGFTLESTGLWHVYGQDQSCGGMFDREQIRDFGLYEGTLLDVLTSVVHERDWNGWTPYGGEVKVGKIHRPKIKKV